MKKLLIIMVSAILLGSPAFAGGHGNVKIGVLLGFTGPIESLTQDMGAGAELAMEEVSATKSFLGGKKVEAIRADSTYSRHKKKNQRHCMLSWIFFFETANKVMEQI